MNKKLFITRSEHDIGNYYLYAYSQEIIDEAKSKGWSVEKAEGVEATRKNVVSRLQNKPALIVFNGHGNENEICGHQDEVLLDHAQSKLLAGSVSFIRACGCLSNLGRIAVTNGAKAVTGYRGDFWIPRTNEYQATPLKDPSAKPVLEASNAVALRLLRGGTVKEAIEASRQKAREMMFAMIVSKEPYDSPALRALISNDMLLDFEGDEAARAIEP